MVVAEVGAGSDYQHWKLVTSDPCVLQTVALEYLLEFISFPQHCRSQVMTLSRDAGKRLAFTEEIIPFLQKNTIEKVHPQHVCFLSSFFLTMKKSGEWQPILNLQPLNKHIKPVDSRWNPWQHYFQNSFVVGYAKNLEIGTWQL